MNDHSDQNAKTFSTSEMGHIDQVLTQFHAAWESGARPRIEDFLAVASGAARAELLMRLLAEEVVCRSRVGETPTAEEYEHRFPADAETVRQVDFSPDGLTLASASDDRTIQLRSVETAELQFTLTGYSDGVTHVADTWQQLPDEPIRYDALDDWGAVAGSLGLSACELLRVNQTPDVEMPVWTSDAIEAVERVCGDDVERSGWEPPKSEQNDT